MNGVIFAIGAVILIIGAGAFLFAFTQLQRYGWSPNGWPDYRNINPYYVVYSSSDHDIALYFGIIGGGIVMLIGLVVFIYGAASKPSKG